MRTSCGFILLMPPSAAGFVANPAPQIRPIPRAAAAETNERFISYGITTARLDMIDEKRAKYCASHFGECLVDEMHVLREGKSRLLDGNQFCNKGLFFLRFSDSFALLQKFETNHRLKHCILNYTFTLLQVFTKSVSLCS
jgi:hypothetical protein